MKTYKRITAIRDSSGEIRKLTVVEIEAVSGGSHGTTLPPPSSTFPTLPPIED